MDWQAGAESGKRIGRPGPAWSGLDKSVHGTSPALARGPAAARVKPMPRIALLSTSDTDLLSARGSGADYGLANPARLDVAAELTALLNSVDLVIVRILGTARTWPDGLNVLAARGLPTVVLGGEQVPDAELMRLSTVPIGVPPRRTGIWPRAAPSTCGSCMRLSALRHCSPGRVSTRRR